MTHGLLEILKYFFLALLWLFFLYAARMIFVDARRDRRAHRRSSSDRGALDRPSVVRLRITEGEYRGETIQVDDEVTFGRSPQCSISLAEDHYASTVHARFFVQDDEAVVEDLGSTNGTYVNDERIEAPVIVARGDRVQIGSTVLEVRG